MAALRAVIHELLAKGATDPNYFWYGARSRRDAPYVDEMRDFAAMYPNSHWHLMLSGKPGRVTCRSDSCMKRY